MTTPLDPPIEIRLPGDAAPRKFGNLERLEKWIGKELQAWEDFKNDVKLISSYNERFHLSNLRSAHSYARAAIKAAREQPDQFQEQRRLLTQNLVNYCKGKTVAAYSAKGVYVRELAKSEPMRALTVLASWDPILNIQSILHEAVSGQEHSVELCKWLWRGAAEANNFDQGINVANQSHVKALNQLRAEWESELTNFEAQKNDAKVRLDYLTSELSTTTEDNLRAQSELQKRYRLDIAKSIRRARASLVSVKRRYKQELAFQIPVTYWKTESIARRDAARFWGAMFILTVLAIVLAILNWRTQIAEFLTGGGADQLYGRLAVFTFAGFLLIWVLRLLSRLLITNLNVMNDARERQVMTQTFLALMDEHHHIRNEDRILILHALFRPSTGSSDDTAPPHWFDLLMGRMKSTT